MDYVDSYTFLVESFHSDYTGRLTMPLLGDHLLAAAGNHSQRRGWGRNALDGTNHTWVLSRLCMEMESFPVQQDQVIVDTWVESVIRMFTNRNFTIRRPDGTIYGYARSVWALIDLQTRKPCDLTTLMDGDILRYVVPVDQNVCPIEGHGKFRFKEPKLLRTIDTYFSDMDVNGHVNSMKYIEHILNLFPASRYSQEHVRRFEIAYKAESFCGDKLSFYCQSDDEKVYDVEVRKNEGEVVCQARVFFEAKNVAR